MEKYEIIPLDMQRMLFGDAPAAYLLECGIRTLIVYIILLIVLKFMGKRMNGQLTITELAVMLSLGEEKARRANHGDGEHACERWVAYAGRNAQICGNPKAGEQCDRCGHNEWVPAAK